MHACCAIIAVSSELGLGEVMQEFTEIYVRLDKVIQEFTELYICRVG